MKKLLLLSLLISSAIFAGEEYKSKKAFLNTPDLQKEYDKKCKKNALTWGSVCTLTTLGGSVCLYKILKNSKTETDLFKISMGISTVPIIVIGGLGIVMNISTYFNGLSYRINRYKAEINALA